MAEGFYVVAATSELAMTRILGVSVAVLGDATRVIAPPLGHRGKGEM